MKLFLIIDETCFYQPNFVAELCRRTKHEIIGAALVTEVLPKSNIELYMIKHFYFLKPLELFFLGIKKIFFLGKNKFQDPSIKNDFYSVRKVFEQYKIPYFEAKKNINTPEYISEIKKLSPDVIISSNSLIFGEEILSIPKYCINRHSGLLPSCGGMWPVFQAVRKGDTHVGVSVHTMEKKIDKGVLLSQKYFKVEEKDTIDTLYQKCFKISAQVVLDALEKIEKNDLKPVKNNFKASYFSFPTKEHWKEFRKRKMKFI